MIARYLLIHGTVDVDLLHGGADPHIGPCKTWSRMLQVLNLVSGSTRSWSPAPRLAGAAEGRAANRTSRKSWWAGGCSRSDCQKTNSAEYGIAPVENQSRKSLCSEQDPVGTFSIAKHRVKCRRRHRSRSPGRRVGRISTPRFSR